MAKQKKAKKRKVANIKLGISEVFCPRSALRVIKHKLNGPKAKGKTFDVINILVDGNARLSILKLARTDEDTPTSRRYAVEGLGRRLVGTKGSMIDEAATRLVL
jgi:hypothetical protein